MSVCNCRTWTRFASRLLGVFARDTRAGKNKNTQNEIKPDGYSSPGFRIIRMVKKKKNGIYDLRSLRSSHPLSGTREKKKEKKRIENLATIEKTASSHKIILINQTQLPVPCRCARRASPRTMGEKCYRRSEKQKEWKSIYKKRNACSLTHTHTHKM